MRFSDYLFNLVSFRAIDLNFNEVASHQSSGHKQNQAQQKRRESLLYDILYYYNKTPFLLPLPSRGVCTPKMRTCSLHRTLILELSTTSHDRNFKSSFYGSPKHPFARATPSLSFKSCHFSVRCAVSFRPCIDIHKGKVKQIVGSTLRDSKEDGSTLVINFESDKSAAEFAKLYKKDGLKGGHVIMLGADPLSQAAAIEALRAYPGGLQVGGGINLDNCLSYIEEGASHVIVTSYVFNNGQMDLQRLKGLVRVVGKQRLVLDLSCRKKEDKYAIVTDRWQKFSDVSVDEEVLHLLANYADEFLVHGVDVEGKKLGIDKDLVALLGEHSPIPVTYAGGVTLMADLETIKAAGKGRVDVTVGSALDVFGGNLAYSDVVAWHDSNRRGINKTSSARPEPFFRS